MFNQVFRFFVSVCLSVAVLGSIAEGQSSNLGALCFGHQRWGSKGEYQDCQETANRINRLGSASVQMRARCSDVRGDLQARLDSGCFTAAFVVQVQSNVEVEKLNAEQRSVRKICESSSIRGDMDENQCRLGTSPYAVQARECAVASAIAECQSKGLSDCSASDATLRYIYYYWDMPRCVAVAAIQK